MEAQYKNKKYRNLLSTLLKQSKQSYFTKFFQENIKDLKNTLKKIKKSSLKRSNQTSSNAIIDNNASLTDPITIANAFNKYFFLLLYQISNPLTDILKQFYDFLLPRNSDSFFIPPAECNEISNIISSISNHRTVVQK